MKNQMQMFQFEDTEVTTIIDEAGQPWWIASEVCKVIGLENIGQAISRLDEDEKTCITLDDVTGYPISPRRRKMLPDLKDRSNERRRSMPRCVSPTRPI